ncbi:MAG: Methylamine utilization protein MauE, partial [Thermoleophilaceae bacterium]|nr:Methylamine utilization protein MauE [Thermoleophilaceae bacterium]
GAFCLFTVRLLRIADEGIDCGCFGGAGSEVSRIHVALNAVAFAVCAASAAWPPPGPDWVFGRAPLTAIAVCIGVAAAAYASFLAFTVFPRAWRSYSNGAAT